MTAGLFLFFTLLISTVGRRTVQSVRAGQHAVCRGTSALSRVCDGLHAQSTCIHVTGERDLMSSIFFHRRAGSSAPTGGLALWRPSHETDLKPARVGSAVRFGHSPSIALWPVSQPEKSTHHTTQPTPTSGNPKQHIVHVVCRPPDQGRLTTHSRFQQ